MMNFNGLRITQRQSRYHPLKSGEITSNDCPERMKATKVAAAYLSMSKARGIRSSFVDAKVK
ncbi:hypothetical protein, partial [Limnofasciculus baicalensis]